MQTVPYKNFKKYLGKIRKCLICNDDPKGIRRVLWAKDEYFRAIKCKKCQQPLSLIAPKVGKADSQVEGIRCQKGCTDIQLDFA